jgi:hypothetical protein
MSHKKRNEYAPQSAVDDTLTCPFCHLTIGIHYWLEENGLVIVWDGKEEK